MRRARIDRILDIAIGLIAGIIIGILLMAAISGCVPGGSAAACPPAYAAESAGLELEAPAEDKVEAKGERPRSPCAEEPPQSGAVGPRDTAQGPGGLRFENRTGRAAAREVPSAASARRLPRGADAKPAQARLVCFRVTAYCPCARCCGKFADGITASGTRADHPLVAAPPGFPFGTVMTVPGYGTVKVEDRGGAIKGNRLDVLFTDHESALQWGVQYLGVEVMR